jgi:amino acid adenylation domain-containing protein
LERNESIRFMTGPQSSTPEPHAEDVAEPLPEWNRTAAPIPETPLQQLFEAHARRAPDSLAVAWSDRPEDRMTYGELDRRANQLAHRLRGLGVRPESLVAILLERSPETVVAVLATVKAGGAWLPIDPVNPGERIAAMLRDSGAAVLLTTTAQLDRLPGLPGLPGVPDLPLPPERVLRLDEEGFSGESTAPPVPFTIDPDHLAYVIYTSGSTGVPKGAALTYRGVANLIGWDHRTFERRPRDRSPLLSGPGFDAAVWEIWAALAAGASLHIPRRETILSPPALLAWLVAEKITLIFLATPLAVALLEEIQAAPAPPGLSLRVLLAGGDRLVRRPWPELPFVLKNIYGPTETTVYATSGLVARTGTRAPDIGTPHDNMRVYLVDPHLRPVPVGEEGELYIAGAGVGRGYRGRPELTAEQFVPNPFEEPGQRMYRTGDLARWLPGGRIEFLGRIDHQVKIRGIRIELGEIESVLVAQPEVATAVVMTREDAAGDRRLVAYVVSTVGAGELRQRLARLLPAAMVPAAWVFLDALPLNPNGKLDRRALERIAPPEPEAATDGSIDAPRTPSEQLLAGLFQEVLKLERAVGLHDDFFHLGGHSLSVVQIASRVRDVLGVDVDLRTVFEHPTVASLAEWIASAAAATTGGRPPAAPIAPVTRGAASPLSYAQQRLWFLDRFESAGTSLYNVPVAFHLTGPGLRVGPLQSALAEIVRRHEVLRTVYRESAGGEPVQVVQPFVEGVASALPVIDLSALPDARAAAEPLERELADRPFDLERGPLLRCWLLRLGAEEHRLVVSMHHIASDAWSLEVLAREISELYQAFAQGLQSPQPPLPPLPIQYADFAIWQRRTLSGEILETELAWWRERLAGLPPALELPADRPRPARPSFRGNRRHSRLAPQTGAGLAALSRRQGATLFMTLMAAFSALLSRYTGEEDLALGTPGAGRGSAETQGLIGFFVNTLVLRTSLAGDVSFPELLARVRTTVLDAYAHQDLPFEQLVVELAPQRDLSRTPLFQVLFALWERTPDLTLSPGLTGSIAELQTASAMFDLALQVTRHGDELLSTAEYATDLFDAATIDRLLGHLGTLLAGIVDEPETRLSRLPLLTAAEQEQLAAWNATLEPRPAGATLHGLFEAQAARTPDAVAVIAAEGALTYRELDALSDRLARRLVALGAGIDSRVGLLLERSPEMVVALLGVLKAGAAYVPLDPDYPAQRVAAMLEDAQVVAVLAQQRLADRLPAGAPVLFLDGDWDREEGDAMPALTAVVPEEAAAYLIFTSGSTGRPKATTVPHRALVNYLLWMQAELPLGPADRVLQKTAFSFDASVWVFWAPLLAGAALVMARPGETREPAALVRGIQEHGVTVLPTVPSMLRVLLDEGLGACRGLRRVCVGGEALGADLQTAFFAVFAERETELVNLYGPTETTIAVTFWRCERELASRPALLGEPIANARLHVLGARLEPCPVGVPGELFVGGVPVSRGYFGRPVETASSFLPDPFATSPGERLYRTGDRVRRRAEGLLEYLGRADGQVKVRGFRVEPGEIEAALAAHPSVGQAAVLALPDPAGGNRLTAYVTGEVEEAELRAFLKQRLPGHMVPTGWVFLDALPLTPNDKVDRGALARLEPAAQRSGAFQAPRTPLEATLAKIFAGVLGVAALGVDDDFFELGGHSLLAMRVIAEIRRTLGAELPVRALFESSTVAGLSLAVEAAREGAPAAIPRGVALRPGSRRPLSFAQQRLWFLDQLTPGSNAYNLPFPLRLQGRLEPPALAAALSEIVRRHEVLRTAYALTEGEPWQAVQPAPLPTLPLVDLTALPGETRGGEALRLAAEDALRPFALAAGRVFRASLVRCGPAEHVLLCSVHHIAFDGWSGELFLAELAALYDAFVAGRESPLPELPWQYADFAAWQRSWLTGEVYERQLAFWRRTLENAPEVLELPADHPRPPVQSLRGEVLRITLPAAMTPVLRALARERSQTLFMLLLAGFQTLLQRYTGQDDLLVATPVAGRHHAEVEDLIGFFVNTLTLRGDLAGDPSFGELLARTRETCLTAFTYQDLPFEVLVEELRPERDMSRSPLVQVMLALRNARRQSPPSLPSPQTRQTRQSTGLRLVPIEEDLHAAKLDLTLEVAEKSDGLLLSFEYATDLFEAATIERLAGHFQSLLAGAAAEPGRRLSELPLLTSVEREQLAAWNATLEPRPAGATLHGLFEAQAARTPDAVAVIAAEGALTYRELDARSNRLARRLVALGAGIDSRVGLFLERSLEMVVALLGVLKAGAAYVPLDPDYPAQRVAAMLEDTQAVAVLAQQRLADRLPAGAPALFLDGDWDREKGDALPALPAVVPEEAAAYLIFTSGSTGRPKATAVPHRAIVNYMLWLQEELPLGPADRVYQMTAFSFDASVWVFWMPLLAGAAVVMARPEETREPAALVRGIQEHGVTMLPTVPSILRVLLDEGLGACRTLRQVCVGGEALGADLQTAFFTVFAERETELVNLYGPTETTIVVTFWRCERELAWRPALLGEAIANAHLHVLGARWEPCPVGVPGELFIGGVQVSRGYFGRPVETASSFLPDPFAAAPGERLYRTGDRVRRRPDGLLEYLGRTDQQVKIRGVRIELGEVEAVIAAHPGVKAVVAVVREDKPREDKPREDKLREDSPGDARLIAYVVADRPDLTPAELRRAAQARLPEAMTPSLFILLDALPRTPTGKVDLRALPSPEPRPEAGHELVAPRTHLEERVAGLWRTVLKVDRLGIHDSFWELGGHSLLATRLTYRVRESFGIELPVRTLFEHPTLAEYAAAIAESLVRPGEQAERMIARTDSGPAPLSHAQQRLWFLDRLQPGLPVYNLPVLFGITGPLAADSLAAALSEIVRRHEVLRTTFRVDAESGDPVQVVAEPVPWPLPHVDLAGLPAALGEAEADRLLAAERRLPFNLERGPLLRSFLVRLGPRDHRLALTMHHIISDGWSVGVLRRELQALYGAVVRDFPSPLPELALQYADVSVWQRRWLAAGEWEAQLAWWRQTLAGAPPTLDLPTDRPRPAVQSLRGGSAALPLGPALSAEVAQLGRRWRTTPFMTLLAAFEALLFRYTGQDDLWVGTPIANRQHAETEDLLGFFVNTLVLRVDLSGDPTFAGLLGRVRERALAAYAHQDLPFEKLVEELAPARDLSRSPLFQVLFAVESERAAPTELAPGVTLDELAVELDIAKFDLTLSVGPGPEGLEAAVEWAADLFDAATLRRLLSHFRVLLTAAAGNPEIRIGELPLLTPEEREEVAAASRGTAAPIPETPLQQLFEAHARRAPDSLAVAWGDRAEDRMTYGELDRRANGLAHHLRGLGVRPESLVAVLLDRSPETAIAVLATVKAGGAWLPIDPANPGERTAAMLRDSGATVLLTAAAQLERLPLPDLPLPPERVLRLDGDGFRDESTAPPEPFAIDPDHLAYVIYTSGSTGMPKGAMLTYRGLANMVGWDHRTFERRPEDRAPLLAGPGFDAAVWEIWGALAAGASLHVPPRETILSSPALLAWLVAERITLAFLATPLAEALLEELQARPLLPDLALRALLTGGERVVRRPWPELTFTLINMYGPTEGTVYATGGIVAPTGTRAPDIGSPFDNTQVYLVDRHLRPVPVGLPGELCIAGVSLARGYLGRPELTAERFVPNPLDGSEKVLGQRMYRTGDLARWLPGSRIEFLGRIDHQVKIRGIRIELGEIESVLTAQPEVAAAVVVVREDPAADRRLVAYVVAPGGPDVIGALELRERLARRLPAAMVPAAWVFLDALPLTPNGKLDRRALPAPEPVRTEGEFIAPRTPLEEEVAAIWRTVLKVDRVGIDDNFWDLGGHSLIATKVLARVRDTFGIDLPLQSLFVTPRLAEFADAVGQSVLAAQGADTAALLAELDGLSDEEIRSFLAAEEIT